MPDRVELEPYEDHNITSHYLKGLYNILGDILDLSLSETDISRGPCKYAVGIRRCIPYQYVGVVSRTTSLMLLQDCY